MTKLAAFLLSLTAAATFWIGVAHSADELSPIVETIAGNGRPENNGDAGPALETAIGEPFGVEIGSDGALYITEVRNHRVRRLDLAARRLTTVAGNGEKGYAGDGGPAVGARLNEPYEVRFDSAGNMYFVEMQNHLVRRVDAATGRIATVAGAGLAGFGGDGGPATEALLSSPHSIALVQDDGGEGGLYIADIGNHRIRKVDLASGRIDTIAGTGETKLPLDGQLARGGSLLGPRALFHADGVLWIALREGHSVWKLDLLSGRLAHVAGAGKRGYAGDGGTAKEALFDGPKGLAVGPRGEIVVVDTENDAIRVIDPSNGTITSISGTVANADGFARPHGVCVGRDGSIFVGDTLNHRVRRIGPNAADR